MATFRELLANALDLVGTATGSKERGWSERVNNYQPTVNTGYDASTGQVDQGMQDWRVNNFVLGSNVSDAGRQAALKGEVLGAQTPPPSGNTGGGGGGGGQEPGVPTPSGENEFEKMVARARAAFESAIRDADYMLDRARGVRDENLGLIGRRRGEFKDLFDTGNIDITNEYQGRGGELGETAQNRRMNDAAALQAMGFGGSAVERAQNRQSRDELRGLRGLQQDRDTNKTENTRQFNERNLWADTQEGAALRAYDDAVNARRSLGEKAGLVQQGDVDAINRSAGDYLGNIQAKQAALAEMGKGITGFVANPLNVVIPSQADAVRAQNYSADTRGGQRGDQSVNLEEQKKKLALLNLQAGGNLYGLA